MSISIIITPHVFFEARSLADKGQTIDGWKLLAAHGDQYAKAAVHVLSLEWSKLNCVRAEHLKLTVPQHPIGGVVWNQIANSALRNYLTFTELNRKQHERDLGEKASARHPFPLPNTRQIEMSYMAAVAEVNARHNAGVNPDCIIHLAGNRFTTPPNTMIEHAVHATARWAGPWKRALGDFTMPDWENVACRDFGDLGARQRHDSEQMSPDGYIRNAYILARAFVTGMAHYYQGMKNMRPRQIAPTTTSVSGTLSNAD